MASYNSDFNRMQEEALSRLREMQKRSRTAVNQPRPPQEHIPPPPGPEQSHHPHHQQQSPPHRQEPAPGNAAHSSDILKSLFGGEMKIDSEKALILLMLFVLYKNKADLKLLLALGYLLM